MWLKWLPWKLIIRRLARAHGFLDPLSLLAHLRKFAQPSEVAEPIELLRAGMVFHARGLINSRVIQHNLDWVWPYWVDRQFDPADPAFIPRAFSITHINLTHRNWTAIGLPDCAALPIVDPRGLLTPFLDEWSLDGWLIGADGRCLLPSRATVAQQHLLIDGDDGLEIVTETRAGALTLESRAVVTEQAGSPVCHLRLSAQMDTQGWIAVALRPYNPEGISFVSEVALSTDRRSWTVNRTRRVSFSRPADHHHVSDYRAGDVYIHLRDLGDEHEGRCEVGMVTAAALFTVEPGQAQTVEVAIPLEHDPSGPSGPGARPTTWPAALSGHCRLSLPDRRLRFLYDAAIRTLILHSPGEVYPGPYTYKRFWFRDAAFIIHALACAGMLDRAGRALDLFPARQTPRGYFHSQDGEWDANGEALWILHRYCELSGRAPKPGWRRAVYQGARWIRHKRLPDAGDAPHAGLLPAGFSAEHLGPNDFYYWDDFWSIAGLRAAANLATAYGDHREAEGFRDEADALSRAVARSLDRARARLGRPAMPASPYRRLDAGAIGSLAAGYPLQLYPGDDPRLLDTVEYLLDSSFVRGGFFQDMTHSGINPYLTLHVAQVLLRNGDPRFADLLTAVADFASPTGQWPEAVHPRTGGGCMGDGQHVWAAAEWVLMLRHCFLREEGDRLILGAGVLPHWLDGDTALAFGPAPTAFGTLSLDIAPAPGGGGAVRVSWRSRWHRPPASIEVRLPGLPPAVLPPGADHAVLRPAGGGG